MAEEEMGMNGQEKYGQIVSTSLVAQWLRLQVSIAGGLGLIPGRGSKIPHAVWHSKEMHLMTNFLNNFLKV